MDAIAGFYQLHAAALFRRACSGDRADRGEVGMLQPTRLPLQDIRTLRLPQQKRSW